MKNLFSRKFLVSMTILIGTFILIGINKITAEVGIPLITSVLGIYSAYNNMDKKGGNNQ